MDLPAQFQSAVGTPSLLERELREGAACRVLVGTKTVLGCKVTVK